MEHLGTKVLETKSLILRPFALEDAEAIYSNWAGDPEVTKYLTWPTHGSIEQSQWVLENYWLNSYNKPDFYQWAIVPKNNNNKPIGSIGTVAGNDKLKMVHMGYCIGRNWWGQGITSEALDALIRFFFEEVGVNRIESRHDTNNPASGKVMEKCGLKYEGTHKQADWNNQGLHDIAMYAILAGEYKV